MGGCIKLVVRKEGMWCWIDGWRKGRDEEDGSHKWRCSRRARWVRKNNTGKATAEERLGIVSLTPFMLPTVTAFFGEYSLNGDVSEGHSRFTGEYCFACFPHPPNSRRHYEGGHGLNWIPLRYIHVSWWRYIAGCVWGHLRWLLRSRCNVIFWRSCFVTECLVWWRACTCQPQGFVLRGSPEGWMLRSVQLGGSWHVQCAHPALWGTRNFCSIQAWYPCCKLPKLRLFSGCQQVACVFPNGWVSR